MSQTDARLAMFRERMAENGLIAMIVTSGTNRRYLSGFTGSAGTLLITMDAAHLLTDSRYYEQAERESPGFRLERAGYAHKARLGELLDGYGIDDLGFEADHLTVDDLKGYREALPDLDFRATTGLPLALRSVKSEAEIDRIREAVALADDAMREAYRIAAPGMTERQLAWALEVFMRERGAEAMAFEMIVAAGENGALPHHHPSDRVIEAGEPIVIDMGARLGGYCSDLTRTFSIGPAKDPDYEAVWEIVHQANLSVTAGLRPGMSGKAVDALARDLIQAAGYGDRFGHSLGHGVGMDVHEAPGVSFRRDDNAMEAGMVITNEPGIYLPGRFGVRIEDILVVRGEGAEVLSAVEKRKTVPFAVNEGIMHRDGTGGSTA